MTSWGATSTLARFVCAALSCASRAHTSRDSLGSRYSAVSSTAAGSGQTFFPTALCASETWWTATPGAVIEGQFLARSATIYAGGIAFGQVGWVLRVLLSISCSP